MNTVIDPEIEVIATRVITNGQWASFYLGYFEASNKFWRDSHRQLDDDALEMLNVLDRGLPRLYALCLCRLWDLPKKDRHSLPTLIGLAAFAQLAMPRDPMFVRDCNKFRSGNLIQDLTQFRIVDLAHNLPIDQTASGFKLDQLREVLRNTQLIIDRLVKMLGKSENSQHTLFQMKRENCERFWQLISPKIAFSDTQ